ncbi:hypothetical protein DEA98_14240 [Brucella pseudogrignonensis]|uniref:Uncharacterized protein n=1 Tax=Brucella pseudogrignonensis TaxID=419475 RepID=A0A7Y3WWV8_9HYPH|nr:hypothetical protein [Brucella pseudogrignonensis]MCM0752024.1 hypothetical protein [Brucella pseudogrignonensis]NNV20546.1 hypothetical protein [Brucella pseudogrignonensis]
MPLIKLTKTSPMNAIVYINTDNIAAIVTMRDFTQVLINASDNEGNLIPIGVTEPARVVADMFNNAR